MPQPQSLDLHELYERVRLEIHAARRYRWHALALAWCVAIVGALLVFALPNQYQATAQVYADTEALMNPLLRGLAVQPDVNGRLDIITHTLLARPNLETVADQTGLALRATTPADKDELLEKLGASVQIKEAGAKNLYNISYSDPDSAMAQKVVQAFLQILMNDTLGGNTTSLQTAQNFLQQQVKDYGDRLTAEEKKIADFNKVNVAYLSSGNPHADYFTQLQAAKADLQALEAQAAGGTRGGTRTVSVADPRIQQMDKQLAALRQQLQTLLLSYTDQYPDVISTRRMIAQLTAQREALVKGRGGSDGTVTTIVRSGNGSSLAAQIAARKQQVAALEANVGKAADAQAALQQLTRNYELTKKQYDDLVARLNTAQLSEDATQSGNNLKFRIISPPIVPLLPVSPNRGLLLLAVFLMAIAIGLAFAWFLHKIKPVFVSLTSLHGFEFPVIGALGLIESPAVRAHRRRELARFVAGVALLGVVIIVGMAFNVGLARFVQHVFVMGVLWAS